jgi:hypothetical protein
MAARSSSASMAALEELLGDGVVGVGDDLDQVLARGAAPRRRGPGIVASWGASVSSPVKVRRACGRGR